MQGAKKFAFLYWYSYYRLIPMDASRKHSDDPDPTFFGEELGRWEGDTLVIDSTGFKDTQVWADENGSPHSDALHVVERWTRPDADHLHVETLIEDPKFYTQIRSPMRGPGSPASRTKKFTNTRAARTMSTRSLGFGPGPIRKDGTRGYENPAPLPPPLPAPAKK